jgi:hypothetical protein
MFAEEKKIYNKYDEEHDDYSDIDGLSICFSHDDYYILFKEGIITHNLIAHELYHLVCSMMDHRMIDDEEARAWLVGYVTALVYQTFDKAKISIGHGH